MKDSDSFYLLLIVSMGLVITMYRCGQFDAVKYCEEGCAKKQSKLEKAEKGLFVTCTCSP